MEEGMVARASRRPYRRRQWIVNPALQYRFIWTMLWLLLLLTAGALASVYLALWWTLRTFELLNEPVAVAQLTTVALLITVEVLLLMPVVVWIGVRLTHRVAGPLVRIMAALDRMTHGDFNVRITLRRGDSMVEVADAVNTLADSLRSRTR